MHILRKAGLGLHMVLLSGLLSACGSGDSGQQQDAVAARASIVSQAPGPTAFIARLGIALQRLDRVRAVSYTIAPRPGTVSRPVSVTYSRSYLLRRGLLDAAGARLDLPVFGLYAGTTNAVSVRIAFDDGSSSALATPVATPAYQETQETAPRYTALDVKTPRQAGVALGYDFMVLKNIVTTPVIVDTDGNLRWIGAGVANAVASTFSGGRFLAGSSAADPNNIGGGAPPVLYRIELDGTVGSVPLSDPAILDFHHDLVPGKTGLLAEVDTLGGGVLHPGTVLAEMDANGRVLKQWDMSAIFSAAMRAGGDDPAGLVRDQADWFHMNSAIYSPADDTLIVSSRENFVVKLDYETGRIRWLLGDPAKFWYLGYPSLRALALNLTAGAPPIGQHGLTIAPDGNLLLFNNGTASFNQPPGAPAGANPGFSTVSEYAIDEAARSAAEVRRYDHGRTLWADICSSATQAADGSYLVDYASLYDHTRSKLVGVGTDGRVAFDYEYPNARCDTAFNAVPIDLGALLLD